MRALVLFPVWVLQGGCALLLKQEQQQVIDQLDREVLALREKNSYLEDQLEHCDQDQGPSELYLELRQVLGATEVRLSEEGASTLIIIPGGLLFSANSNKIRQEASMVLDLLSVVLHKHGDHRIQITSHVSSSALSSSLRRKYVGHWEYAGAQSAVLMHTLVDKFGVDEARFTLSSRGSIEPAVDGHDTERRLPDWRVLIRVDPPASEEGK